MRSRATPTTGANRPTGRHAGTAALGRGVLLRYRVMAFATAILLVVLVFVGVPLQLAAGQPGVVNVVGTLHGFLYLVYLVTAFALTRRLAIPKWQMLLVLLAGTVPLCAFVAERKMTHRFDAVANAGGAGSRGGSRAATEADRRERMKRLRERWLSRRALLLHAEVLIVAPGCGLAGWWQATSALAGNQLSWVYSVEWPIFGLIAIYAWWHLVHEDPAAYEARRRRTRDRGVGVGIAASAPGPDASLASTDVEATTARLATALVVAVGVEIVTGIVSLFFVPFGRPSGWVPAQGAAFYGVHATIGLLVAIGALAYLVLTSGMGRIARISAWTGAVCVVVASAGGLLTEQASLVRFLGIAVMFVGATLAAGAYVVPLVLRARSSGEPAGGPMPGAPPRGEPRPEVSPAPR